MIFWLGHHASTKIRVRSSQCRKKPVERDLEGSLKLLYYNGDYIGIMEKKVETPMI